MPDLKTKRAYKRAYLRPRRAERAERANFKHERADLKL